MNAHLDTLPVVVVTGSASGLGAAIALALADEYTVVVHYLSSESKAEKTVQRIRQQSPGSSMMQADLCDADQVQQMMDVVIERYGRLDLLINTVGNFVYAPLADTSAAEWDDMIESNLSSVFYTCSSVLPQMRAQQSGRIVNFGSVDAGRMLVRPNTTPYYIAKTGVVMLTKQMAAENAQHGITVNAISPGILESSKVKIATPTGKLVAFDDIIRAVMFLIDPKNCAVNGANIEVAGGFTF